MDIKQYLETTKISQSDFALLADVSPGMVYQWLKELKPVSTEKCVLIEQKTNGAVSRKDLRPNDWLAHWPELADEQVL